MKRFVLILSAALLFAQGQASAQFPGMPRVNRDSLNALTNADHAQMLGQLGLSGVRPGRDAYTDDPNRAPNYDEMKANPWIYYPDPLVTFDGRRVKNAKMWRNVRRPELVKAIPCIRRDLAGVADNSACPSIEVRIQAQVTWPEAAKGPVPVIMEFGFIMPAGMNFNFPGGNNRPRAKSWQQQVVERGWAAAVIVTGSIQADGGHGLRQGIVGLTNKGDYRKPTDWGALRAWAWGASKLVDYFETTREFDATKVAIEGVSRNGKAALVTMAFDERFAAALVASAGEGGSSPWRRNCGESLGNLADAGEYHWMCGNFIKYGADPLTENDLPVDQHELIALCAPRPCFISSGTWDATTGCAATSSNTERIRSRRTTCLWTSTNSSPCAPRAPASSPAAPGMRTSGRTSSACSWLPSRLRQSMSSWAKRVWTRTCIPARTWASSRASSPSVSTTAATSPAPTGPISSISSISTSSRNKTTPPYS